jgi:hypothetical protein
MAGLTGTLAALDEVFDRPAWHGPNRRGPLREITLERAAWRPVPGAHSVWELVVHAAYWKYVAQRRIAGGKRSSFALPGSNFFPRPAERTKAAWDADLQLLAEEQARLWEAVATANADGARIARLIRGAAAHYVNHPGQIRLLRRRCPT